MRIGFLGKGGAGKTSIAAAYTRHSARNGHPTLAIDVDVNTHLGEALGFKQSPRFLGGIFGEVATFLDRGRDDYKNLGLSEIPCFGSLPPHEKSVFIRVDENDSFIKSFGVSRGGISLLAVGPHADSDFSSSCYHYKLNSIELPLHRLLDFRNDRVVCDSAAGTDSLGTSLYMVHDLQVFVVEPTTQSLAVFKDYRTRAEKLGVKLRCVLNKIRSVKEEQFLKQHIPSHYILGAVEYSRDLRSFEQGDVVGNERFSQKYSVLWDTIDTNLCECSRNWPEYFAKLRQLYEAECVRWWNPYYQVDLREVAWNSAEVVAARVQTL